MPHLTNTCAEVQLRMFGESRSFSGVLFSTLVMGTVEIHAGRAAKNDLIFRFDASPNSSERLLVWRARELFAFFSRMKVTRTVWADSNERRTNLIDQLESGPPSVRRIVQEFVRDKFTRF
jgi:hypothetical protein